MPDAGFPVAIVTGVPVVTTCEEIACTSRHARCTGFARSRPSPPVEAFKASVARIASATEKAWPRRLTIRSSVEIEALLSLPEPLITVYSHMGICQEKLPRPLLKIPIND